MGILISGAGIAGLSMALMFEKMKIPYTLVEKNEHSTPQGAGIALPPNAVKALRYLGLGAQIEQYTHSVTHINYCEPSGELLSQASLLAPPLNTDRFVAIHRHKLHNILLLQIQANIHYNTSIREIKNEEEGLSVLFNSPTLKRGRYNAIIGADGLHSSTRMHAFPKSETIDHGITSWRWTCEYPTDTIQPTYFIGSGDVFMVYPIGKNEVNCYANLPDPQNQFSSELNRKKILLHKFARYDGLAKTMLERLPDNSSIITGRAVSLIKPYFYFDRIALIGDASHACTSMLQQGAAGALEDAIILANLIKQLPIQNAFVKYEEIRKERVNWVMKTSDDRQKIFMQHLDPEKLAIRNERVRQYGPPNVVEWRKLLQDDPLTQCEELLTF